MVRLAHVSDTHLQRTTYYGNERGTDYRRAAVRAIELADDRDVDAIVHTGDLTDAPNPDGAVVEDVRTFCRAVADTGLPYFQVVGNHPLDDGEPDEVLTRIIESDLAHHLRPDDPGRVGNVALYGVDYRDPDRWPDPDLRLSDPPAGTDRVVLCFHQTFGPFGAPWAHAADLATVLDNRRVDVDAVLLGHRHRAEARVVDGVPAFYAGATEREDRKYADYRPSFNVVTIADGRVEVEVVPIDAVRPFEAHTVVTGGDPSTRVRELSAALTEGAVADVVVTDPDPPGERDPPEENDAPGEQEDDPRRPPPALSRDAVDDLADENDLLYAVYTHDPGVLSGLPPGVYEGTPETLPGEHPMARYHGDEDGARPGLLHVGATYVGRYNLDAARTAEFSRRFEAVANYATWAGADAVVHTGNLFGTKSPTKRSVRRLEQALRTIRHAEVPVYHVPSPREREMDEVDRLRRTDLLRSLGAEPAVVGGVALYGAPPDPGEALTVLRNLRAPDEPVRTGVLALHLPVAPPVPDATGLTYRQVVDAIPADVPVDAVVGGGVDAAREHRPEDGPRVFYPGPTERELGLHTFETPPERGSVTTLGFDADDGWAVEAERDVDARPLGLAEVDCDADATPGDVAAAVVDAVDLADLDGALLLVKLGGEKRTSDDLDGETLRDRLDADPFLVEVWDYRDVAG